MDRGVIFTVTLLMLKCLVQGSEVRTFPKDFAFGAATAAYQVEGAWNEDGKSESIWDRLMHEKSCFTYDCKNGDIAADSYHNIHRDVEMMTELGLDFYRFSISWTRILPNGFANEINYLGVAYYHQLLAELHKNNIEPVVTIYHWDLPQIFQDMGGWLNPMVIDWYADYARVLFELFGNRVKKWITINEPAQICLLGYDIALLAPAFNFSGIGMFLCSENVLLAHAGVWRMYDEEFRSEQKGHIGITIATEFFAPESPEHESIAQLYNDFWWGIYAHPIFSEQGDFPQTVKDRVAAKSDAQGFPRSRLPVLSQKKIDFIKGTSDFFGMNHYTTYLAYSNSSVVAIYDSPSFYDDIDGGYYKPDEWLKGEEPTMILPWGFYAVLRKITKDYNNPPIFVTENGYAYSSRGVDDEYRTIYFHEYLNAMLDAMEDGSNVIGYTAWSLMDNFEWWQGYTQCYGLYEVDFDSPNRTRTARKSVSFYKDILRTRRIARNLTTEAPSIEAQEQKTNEKYTEAAIESITTTEGATINHFTILQKITFYFTDVFDKVKAVVIDDSKDQEK